MGSNIRWIHCFGIDHTEEIVSILKTRQDSAEVQIVKTFWKQTPFVVLHADKATRWVFVGSKDAVWLLVL